MKRSIQIVLMLVLYTNAQSQTWEEWTQQKKLAIQRLREQIAANQSYLDYAKKGYTLVSQGLQTIEKIKQGDYTLHLGYYDSLLLINPRIKGWAKVEEILKLNVQLIKVSKSALKAIQESAQFKADEQKYGRQVVGRMVGASAEYLDELKILIGTSSIQLTDDERIKRIDQIYVDMQDKVSFMSAFTNEMSVMALQRLTERTEIEYSKKIR